MTRFRSGFNKRAMRRTLIAAALVAAQALAAQSPVVTGTIFIDANRNGTRDQGERGVADVTVSNQQQVVRSAADGTYALPGAGYGVIFVSLPDGFDASGSFWRKPASGEADIGLVPRETRRDFSFIHASDTHVSAQSLSRMQRLRAIVDQQKPDFVIVTGDLVRDALRVGEAEAAGYYDMYLAETRQFTVPVWSVPGNHENFGIERHLSLVSARHPLYAKGMYRARLGPNYYSFTRGGVHFVGLDSVDIEDLWYYGHVDPVQLAWLRADLAQIAPSTPVVTFNHIPFVSAVESANGFRDEGTAPSLIKVGSKTVYRHIVSNFREVLAIMSGHDWTLALGGHLHTRETIRFESSTHTRFFQAAAIVGPTEGPVPAISGVTLYRASAGTIDDGTFLPLDEKR